MALVEIRRFSEVFERRVGCYVILPDVGEPPYPSLYLLHGLTDDYTGWVRKSRIEYYVREKPLIVVMPDGFRNWYLDEGIPETVRYVEKFFPTNQTRYISGLSMGGYGALANALKTGLFQSATSHSGALIPWERNPPFADGPSQHPEHDLLLLAAKAQNPPRMWLDCGTADANWIEINRKVHAQLSVPHEYREFTGGHDWDYWDMRITDLLAFHKI